MYGVMLEDSTVKIVNILGGLLYVLYIFTYLRYAINKVAITVYACMYVRMYECMYVCLYIHLYQPFSTILLLHVLCIQFGGGYFLNDVTEGLLLVFYDFTFDVVKDISCLFVVGYCCFCCIEVTRFLLLLNSPVVGRVAR